MPYNTFKKWLFDGNLKTPLPTLENGTSLLKYNSPISHTYVIQLFMRDLKLNHYLNETFNNINLRSLDKEELFFFLKKCVKHSRFRQNRIYFHKWPHQEKLFTTLREKHPHFKNTDISLLAEIIEKRDDRDQIFNSIGLQAPTKKKFTLSERKKRSGKISAKDYIAKNFALIEVRPSKSK